MIINRQLKSNFFIVTGLILLCIAIAPLLWNILCIVAACILIKYGFAIRSYRTSSFAFRAWHNNLKF